MVRLRQRHQPLREDTPSQPLSDAEGEWEQPNDHNVMDAFMSWIDTIRPLATLCFVYGAIMEYWRPWSDADLGDAVPYAPSASTMICITGVLITTAAVAAYEQFGAAHCSGMVVYPLITYIGTRAGALVEHHTTRLPGKMKLQLRFYMPVCVVVFSFALRYLNYRWLISFKKFLLVRGAITACVWMCVHAFTAPDALLVRFVRDYTVASLAASIIDYAVQYSRSLITRIPAPIFHRQQCAAIVEALFHLVCISYLVTSHWNNEGTMMTPSSSLSSWYMRTSTWTVLAAVVVVEAMVGHALHWTIEKIFGPAPDTTRIVMGLLTLTTVWLLVIFAYFDYRLKQRGIDLVL